MDEKKSISLIDLEKNKNAVIISIDSGWQSAKRLADLGLTPNTPIKILRKTLFLGPIEIEARGCKLALGRGVASKILVKEL
jgi:Fe2+ transport system protein FeoA